MLSGNTIITTDTSLAVIKQHEREKAIAEYKEKLIEQMDYKRVEVGLNTITKHLEGGLTLAIELIKSIN